jgi:hypothetical protein
VCITCSHTNPCNKAQQMTTKCMHRCHKYAPCVTDTGSSVTDTGLATTCTLWGAICLQCCLQVPLHCAPFVRYLHSRRKREHFCFELHSYRCNID